MKEYISLTNRDPMKTTTKFEKRYSNFFVVPQGDKLGIKTNISFPPTHFDGKNIWLIKAPDLNRGRCIKIGNNLQTIQKLIKKFYDGIMRDFKQSDEEEYKQSVNKVKSKEEGIILDIYLRSQKDKAGSSQLWNRREKIQDQFHAATKIYREASIVLWKKV
jgi:hypothetical protein